MCLAGMSDSRRFKRAFVLCVYGSEGRKEAGPPFGWEVIRSWKDRVFFLFFSDVHRIFFKPQTHQHWIPRRLRLQSQQNPKRTIGGRAIRRVWKRQALAEYIVEKNKNKGVVTVATCRVGGGMGCDGRHAQVSQ